MNPRDILNPIMQLNTARLQATRTLRLARRELEDEEEKLSFAGRDERDAIRDAMREVTSRVDSSKMEARSIAKQFDEELANLAAQSRDVFPELPRLCDEIGVDLQPNLPFDGLVKTVCSEDALQMYDNVEKLGAGGRHAMYTAECDGRLVCLKEYTLVDDKARRGLAREVTLLNRLRHASIINISAVVCDTLGQRVYVEMDFYQGGHLGKHRNADEDQKVIAVHDLALAIQYMHRYARNHFCWTSV